MILPPMVLSLRLRRFVEPRMCPAFRVRSASGWDIRPRFLGFAFQGYGGQFRVARKNLDKFRTRIREITGRNRGVSFTRRSVELRRYFQGWVG